MHAKWPSSLHAAPPNIHNMEALGFPGHQKHKKILKNQYVTKYEQNFKQNINAIKNITVDGSKEIRGMIPAKETVENSVSDWIQVFSLSSTEFLNGFHDGKKEIESSENDENQSDNGEVQNKKEETQTGLESDYNIDEYKMDEELVDTDSNKESSENVIQKQLYLLSPLKVLEL